MLSLKSAALGAAFMANAALSADVFVPRMATFGAVSDAVSKLSIDSANRVFTDAEGRQVIMHGVNVVYKMPPYIPEDTGFDPELSLSDEDIANLKKWGFNLVRLGVMWEGVEREQGVYDMAYLDSIEKLINKLGDAGIYTLVDAHQDVFARKICGEGVPDFYAQSAIGKKPECFNWFLDKTIAPFLAKFGICTDFDSYGFAVDENGDPEIPDCQTRDFYTYYETKQSMEAFHSLLVTNKDGIQDAFVNFWEAVVTRFAGNDYVVGYDPLNEPFPGNPTRDLMNLKPGHFDYHYLAPLYAKIFEKMQATDASKQMWFEPVPFPDIAGVLGGWVFHVGFTTPPGGEVGSNLHALNDHTYCCQMDASECATGEPQIAHADKCLKFHEARINTRAKDAERLGVPLIITEFGACLTEGPCSQEINQVAQVADENLVGWAYWEFKTYKDLTTSAGTGSEGFYNNDGSLQEYKVKALGRPYMPYTQGVLSSMQYEPTTNAFTAEFTLGSNLDSAESVAFLSKDYYYPNGISYTITLNGEEISASQVNATYADNYLHFTFDQSFADAVGQTVTVNVVSA